MSTSIILALDGSEGSERAVPVAEQYARRDGARLVVAHARTHALETAIEDTLNARVEQLSQSDIETSMVIRDTLFGDEAQTIADIAKDADAGLIVIASRGRGPFTGACSEARRSGSCRSPAARSSSSRAATRVKGW